MKEIRETEILHKILLPLNQEWVISEVKTEGEEEIFVILRYTRDYVESGGQSYPIYDWRKERKWRHLDLWQYKTYIVAQLPRYKDEHGFFKTISVPWADEYERLTSLLEKKR
jgi:transposase